MAGEAEPLAVALPPAGEAPAPAAASPVAAPVAAPEVVPAVVEPAAPVPAVEPVPAPEPTHLDKPSLLETIGKDDKKPEPAKPEPAKVEAKPAEPKPEGPAAKVEGTVEPAAPAAPDPVAYEYALPETIKMDDALKGSFHTALDAFRADPAKGAQGLIDLHNQTMQTYADSLKVETARQQQEAFANTRQEWYKEIMADEELGGAGHQTAAGAVARMRDLLIPAEYQQPRKWPDGSPRLSEAEEFFRVTGAGDNKIMWKILHNAARYFDEAPMPPPGGRPPADMGKPPGRGGLRGLYKSSNGQGRQ
jgi:hypothetical protein